MFRHKDMFFQHSRNGIIYCSVMSILINAYMCVHIVRLSDKRKGENLLFMLLLYSVIVLTFVKRSCAFCFHFYFYGFYRIFHVILTSSIRGRGVSFFLTDIYLISFLSFILITEVFWALLSAGI